MKKDYGYPSYDLICRETSGDKNAIREILDFYNAYISKVCLRPCYHAKGTIHMQVDEEFLQAIEAGMPPAGGMGMGLDRLLMAITGLGIRETITFPLVKRI